MSSTTAPHSPVRRPRRRGLKLLLLVIAVTIASFAVVALVVGLNDNARLKRAIEAADLLDPGWRIADIEAARLPFPPEEQNAGLHVLTLRQLVPANWLKWSFPQFDADPAYLKQVQDAMGHTLDAVHVGSALLDAEQERVLRFEMGRGDKAVAAARRLADFPDGRYPLKWTKDYVSVMLPHVQAAQLAAEMLRYDGMLRAHDNDSAGACLNVRAILHAARGLGDEPFLVTQARRTWIDRRAVQLLERVLSLCEPREADLAPLQAELAQEAETPFFLMAMRGERAANDGLLENTQKGEVSFVAFKDVVAQIRPGPAPAPRPRGPLDEIALWRDAARIYLGVRRLRAQRLEQGAKLVAIAKLPQEEQLDALDAFNKDAAAQAPEPLEFLTSSTRGHTRQLLLKDLEIRSLLRAAVAAVATERFRLAHGRWPAQLEELTPRYLAIVPRDPFTGSPLQFLVKGRQLAIYSVGADKTDDGDVFLAFDPREVDIGFILFDADARRQPPRPFPFP